MLCRREHREGAVRHVREGRSGQHSEERVDQGGGKSQDLGLGRRPIVTFDQEDDGFSAR